MREAGGKSLRTGSGRGFQGDRIEAVVFDLDDTLWPIAPTIMRAEQAMREWISANVPEVAARWDADTLKLLRAKLIAADPSLHNDVMALRRGTILAAFEACGGSAAQAEAAFELFRAERQKVTFYPDALPALERLARHFRLGVISNGFANVAAIGIGHHFDSVVSAHEVGFSKPDPRIYAACAQRMGLAPQQMLYVGDDPHNDIVGPTLAGLQAAWINRLGASWPQSLGASHSPEIAFADLGAFADWMLEAREGSGAQGSDGDGGAGHGN